MITQIDFKIIEFLQTHAAPVPDVFFAAITHLGDGGIFWIILAVALICFKKTRRCGVMMGAALICGLIIGNGALKNLIARDRPFIQDPVLQNYLLISPPSGFSCPSGHTLASFECAAVIFMNNKKWGTAALVLAALIGFSRIYLCVHFPSDVLFGLALGIAIGICVYFAYKKFIKEKNIEKKLGIE